MLNGALIAFICLIYELLKQVVGWLEVAVL
jgi:hypothetical protein